MVSGLVARVSGKVDVPGRTEPAPMGCTIAYCRVSSRDRTRSCSLMPCTRTGMTSCSPRKNPASTACSGRSSAGPWPPCRPRHPGVLEAPTVGPLGRARTDYRRRAARPRVTVRSLTENFDLDTKEGRFMFAVLAAAAEYELELRAERQAEGITAVTSRCIWRGEALLTCGASLRSRAGAWHHAGSNENHPSRARSDAKPARPVCAAELGRSPL